MYRIEVLDPTAVPDGVSIAADGTITGTPTVEGFYQVPIAIVDVATGESAPSTLLIQVEPRNVSPGTDANGAAPGGENDHSWWVEFRDATRGEQGCNLGGSLGMIAAAMMLMLGGRRRR